MAPGLSLAHGSQLTAHRLRNLLLLFLRLFLLGLLFLGSFLLRLFYCFLFIGRLSFIGSLIERDFVVTSRAF